MFQKTLELAGVTKREKNMEKRRVPLRMVNGGLSTLGGSVDGELDAGLTVSWPGARPKYFWHAGT